MDRSDRRPADPTDRKVRRDVGGPGEQSDPPDPDGQFDSQDMPTTDGEMSDGAASDPEAPA